MAVIIKHKFKAKPLWDDQQYFSSKLEWLYYKKLEMLKKIGEVIFYLRQVPFHLPGGVKYVVDYQVFYRDGNISFVECKGFETSEFKTKKKLVESIYPIQIDIVKKID